MTDILDQAMRLKQAQLDQERPRWNSWPAFAQNTVFHIDKAEVARTRLPPEVPSGGSLAVTVMRRATAACQDLRQTGNNAFRDNKVADAAFRFEESVGQFDYVLPLHGEWKKAGIRDQDVRRVVFQPLRWSKVLSDNLGMIACAKHELCASYVNLSLALFKQGRHTEAKIAAERVVAELNPWHLKAAHRYASAAIAPASAGISETKAAIDVLDACLVHVEEISEFSSSAVLEQYGDRTGSGANLLEHIRECRTLLASLQEQHATAEARGKKMFQGVFDREEWRELADGPQASVPVGGPQQSPPTAADLAHDPLAEVDAAAFPAEAARAPIFRDTLQGWNVINRLRREALDMGAGRPAEVHLAKASQLERDLVVVCATKVHGEALQPAMATSPALLRFDIGSSSNTKHLLASGGGGKRERTKTSVDPLRLRDNPALAHGRSMLRLLGFSPSLWNAACRGDADPTASKEALLYEALTQRCRRSYSQDAVRKLHPADVAGYLALHRRISPEELASAVAVRGSLSGTASTNDDHTTNGNAVGQATTPLVEKLRARLTSLRRAACSAPS